MGALAPWHIIVLVLVIVLLFGSKKLGDVGKGLGQSVREFRSGVTGTPDPPPAAPTGSGAETDAERVRHELDPDDAVAVHQETPAPTPEIARAEEADERRE